MFLFQFYMLYFESSILIWVVFKKKTAIGYTKDKEKGHIPPMLYLYLSIHGPYTDEIREDLFLIILEENCLLCTWLPMMSAGFKSDLTVGVGRSISAPMHCDTKFDNIWIDTHNH